MQASFGVSAVAREAYVDISVSRSINQSINHSNPYSLLPHTDLILSSWEAGGELTARMFPESFDVLDVASEAYGDFSVKLCGAFGVLDVASEAYGELHRYAQASFGVLDVASEAYGGISVSCSFNQSINQSINHSNPYSFFPPPYSPHLKLLGS